MRISYIGLAANPVKTLSLPVNLLSVKERSGQEVAQSTGKNFLPFSFSIFVDRIH
jgi:hypothetical protein